MKINPRTIKEEYDEFRIPGSIDLALKHRSSCNFGPKDDSSELLESSNKYVVRKKMSFFCKTEDLEFLGPGIPLFFKFMRNCFIILIVTFIFQSIYALYTYSNSNNCQTFDVIKK